MDKVTIEEVRKFLDSAEEMDKDSRKEFVSRIIYTLSNDSSEETKDIFESLKKDIDKHLDSIRDIMRDENVELNELLKIYDLLEAKRKENLNMTSSVLPNFGIKGSSPFRSIQTRKS